MKTSFFTGRGWLALLLPLLFAGNSFAQSAKLPFLLDIPDGENPCHLLSGDHKDKFLALAAEPAGQKKAARRATNADPAPQGLHLSKNGDAKESKWAFKPAQEENVNGEYFIECMDGTERVVAWSDVEGFFFRPLSMMDGKMREMATWNVALGGISDIGETYYIIHPKNDAGKVLAVDRKTDQVDVFADPGAAQEKATLKRIEQAEKAVPDLEVLWKRACKK
ncbi:MAG: hypothetical protein H6557_26965 [Lewinellaceae bacterium]|nr:hypothetical protein [Phaeodactylibacter sp.]MCB9040283.1 hypothetical protein [Lewinellaceae bacterium]